MVACMPLLLVSQTFSEKREESKTYRLKPGTLVQVSNKYGNVNIMNWEKDSVRFEVSISVQSKQPSKLNKILTSIDCEMVSTASVISARTVFHDNSATFWKDVVSYAGKVVNTSNNLQIHYTVYLPEANPVKIENKFGNITQTSDNGFFIAATSYSQVSGDKTENNLGQENNWVVKLDPTGNVLWDKTIFTSGRDDSGFAYLLNDGSIVAANHTNGQIAGYKSQDTYDITKKYCDFWIVKL